MSLILGQGRESGQSILTLHLMHEPLANRTSQFADKNESCNVLGIDICPMQPTEVHPSVCFALDNFDSPQYEETEHRYHYIHGRCLGGCVTDWPRLLSMAFRYGLGTSDQIYADIARAIRPGGCIELAQDDIKLTSAEGELDPMLSWWVQMMICAGTKSGKTFDICGKLKYWLLEAGFINVEEIRVPVPVDYTPDDPKQLGMLNLDRLLLGLDGFSLRPLVGTLGMDANEVKISLAGVRQALRDARHNVYQDL